MDSSRYRVLGRRAHSLSAVVFGVMAFGVAESAGAPYSSCDELTFAQCRDGTAPLTWGDGPSLPWNPQPLTEQNPGPGPVNGGRGGQVFFSPKTGPLPIPPHVGPGDYFPQSRYDMGPDTAADVKKSHPVCTGVGPNCVNPEYGNDPGPKGSSRGDPRLPASQGTGSQGTRRTTPHTDPLTADGAFHFDRTFLQFPGFIPYVFGLHYRSDVSFQSPIGFGWNHNYGRHIVPARIRYENATDCLTGPADVFYVSDTLDRIRFAYDSSDADGDHFRTSADPALRLSRDSTKVYRLDDGSGLTYSFDSVFGDLVEVRDHTGHRLRLTWNHPTPQPAGSENPGGYLLSVTDTRGINVYYRYLDGNVPLDPAFPTYRPLQCITLDPDSTHGCQGALVLLGTDVTQPGREFNLLNVTDAYQHGLSFSYLGAQADPGYLPDEILGSTCDSICGATATDCRNLDLCSAEIGQGCSAIRSANVQLSLPLVERSPCFDFCMSHKWNGSNYDNAYKFCNIVAGCPLDSTSCNDYSQRGWQPCWRYTPCNPPLDNTTCPSQIALTCHRTIDTNSCPECDRWQSQYFQALSSCNGITAGCPAFMDFYYTYGSCGGSPTSCGYWYPDVSVSRNPPAPDQCATFATQCEAEAAQAAPAQLANCRATCKATCMAEKAGKQNGVHVYTYGTPSSLAHNLLEVIDADNRLVVGNTYGTDPFAPDFDRVKRHVQGNVFDNVMTFVYHDFNAEGAPVGFNSVNLCPLASSGSGYAHEIQSSGIDAIQKPAHAIQVTDIGGVKRTNLFDWRWAPLREVNVSANTAIDYNYDADGNLIAIRDALGVRTCFERDDHGRPVSITRLPAAAPPNQVVDDPEVTVLDYDDAGEIVSVIKNPDNQPIGVYLLRDVFERVAAVGTAISATKTIWTCYDYTPPPARHAPPSPGSGASPPATSRGKIKQKILRALGGGITSAQIVSRARGGRGPLSFGLSGCASKLKLPRFTRFAALAEPTSITKPDGSTVVQHGLSALGPSEVIVDAGGVDPLPKYVQFDTTDPFAANAETGVGTLQSKRAGSARVTVADKLTGRIQKISVQAPDTGALVDTSFDYWLSGDVKRISTELLDTTIETDALGHVTSVSQAPKNDVFKTPPSSRCFNWTMDGRPLDTMSAEGNVTHYYYNGLRQLSFIKRGTDASSLPWASTCRAAQKMSPKSNGPTTTALWQVVSYTYNDKGALVGIDEPGVHTDLTLDGFGRVIDRAIKRFDTNGPNGPVRAARHYVSGYDALGRVVWSGTFDEPHFQKPVAPQPWMHEMTEYQYDGLGRPKTVDRWRFTRQGSNPPKIDPAGLLARTKWDYDDAKATVTMTDPEGKVSVTSIDGAGRTKHVTLAYGAADHLESDYAWSGGGAALAVTSNRVPINRAYAYDPRGALRTIVTGGDTQHPDAEITYDRFGRIATARSRGMGVISSAYDSLDRLRVSGQPTGTTSLASRYSFDRDDRLTRASDGAGRVQEYSYDALDRVVQSKNGLGVTTNIYSAGSPRVLQSTDPALTKTDLTYQYDGQLISQITTDGKLLPSAGRVTKRSFSYDNLGRLATAAVGGATGPNESTIQFQYDSLSRVLSEWNDNLPVSIGRQYSPGSIATMILDRTSPLPAVAATMTESYDDLYRAKTLDVATPARKLAVAQFQYVGGLLSGIAYGNGIAATVAHEPRGRLSSIEWKSRGSTVARMSDNLGLDTVVRERQRFVAPEADAIDYFEVDLGGRLTVENLLQKNAGFHGVDITNQTIDPLLDRLHSFGAYTLDASSNWSARSGTTPFISGTPDGANRYPNIDNSAVQYDAAGNLQKYGSDQYTFDGLGQMRSASVGAGTVSYQYDALGRPVREKQGRTTSLLVWSGSTLVAMGPDTRKPGDLKLVAGTGGEQRQAVVEGLGAGAAWFLLPGTDLVSPLAVSGTEGTAAEAYAYSAYGETTVFDANGNKISKPSPRIGNRFGYKGALFVPDVGLYSMGRRFYKPTWGRFVSPDPLDLAEGTNRYSFVGGRVLTDSDPTGRCSQLTFYSDADRDAATAFDQLANRARADGRLAITGTRNYDRKHLEYTSENWSALAFRPARNGTGYQYKMAWNIGWEDSNLTPERVIAAVLSDPNKFFPFTVAQPTLHWLPTYVPGNGVAWDLFDPRLAFNLHLDGVYDLQGSRFPGDIDNHVWVSDVSPTSFTFLAQPNHFDPGGTIRFSSFVEDGIVYWQQEGYAPHAPWYLWSGSPAYLGIVNTWSTQASNIRTFFAREWLDSVEGRTWERRMLRNEGESWPTRYLGGMH